MQSVRNDRSFPPNHESLQVSFGIISPASYPVRSFRSTSPVSFARKSQFPTLSVPKNVIITNSGEKSLFSSNALGTRTCRCLSSSKTLRTKGEPPVAWSGQSIAPFSSELRLLCRRSSPPPTTTTGRTFPAFLVSCRPLAARGSSPPDGTPCFVVREQTVVGQGLPAGPHSPPGVVGNDGISLCVMVESGMGSTKGGGT